MVISLSGSGIRAHSRGMNVICSNSELIGYSSACFNPANEQYGHGSVTQITCGSPLSNELSHLDLYSGLREISRPGAGDYVTSVKSGGGVGGGYILAGCRDGSVKVMDGGEAKPFDDVFAFLQPLLTRFALASLRSSQDFEAPRRGMSRKSARITDPLRGLPSALTERWSARLEAREAERGATLITTS